MGMLFVGMRMDRILMRMIMRVVVRMGMRMRLCVRMRMHCRRMPARVRMRSVLVPMIVRRDCMGVVRRIRCVRRRIRPDHVHFGSGNAAAAHLARFQARAYIQRSRRLFKPSERHAGVYERAKHHVAAYAGKTLQVSSAHRDEILYFRGDLRKPALSPDRSSSAAARQHFSGQQIVH